MRLNRSINSLLALSASLLWGQALACGDCWDFSSFVGEIYQTDGSSTHEYSKEILRQRNIQLWMRQTGLPQDRVVKAVYDKQPLTPELLRGDTAALHFLTVARACEDARAQLASPWYYAVDGDEPQTSLHSIAAEAEAMALTSSKMHERYALQAIRAHFALREYAECITLWTALDATVKEPVIRDLALPYVAGCYYHLHEVEKALPIFLRYGDMESIRLCNRMLSNQTDHDPENFEDADENEDNTVFYYYDDCNLLELTARFFPESPDLAHVIMKEMNTLCYTDSHTQQVMRETAVKASKITKGENRGLWLYTAAILSNEMEEEQLAIKYLSEAKRCSITPKMANYIRLLEADIFFRTAVVNSYYYKRIEEELRWMDKCMFNSFDRNAISAHLDAHRYYFTYSNMPTNEADFWNQALHQVFINNVCKRLETSRDYQLMLRLTNYTENRYLHLCDGSNLREYALWKYNSVTDNYERCDDIETKDEKFSYHNYVRSTDSKVWNCNYSTQLFMLADSLPADILSEYISWLQKPHSGYEALLVTGSNADKDYWNEMLGTHYLREQKFEAAAKVFKMVASSFIQSMNLYKDYCFNRNPFALNPRHTSTDNPVNLKLNFAQKMASLSKAMNEGDPNDRAEAMLLYARGLKNSVGSCWSLTAYGWSCYEDETPYMYGNISFEDQILKEAKRIEPEAFKLFTDRERKARALVDSNRRLEVMRDMRDTEAAFLLERHCDLWRDYAQAHPVKND